MFEAIKNLNPTHRLAAFLFVVIISTGSAIITTYVSTDDCSGLATQYNSLVKNYTETLGVNNELIKDNNQKQKDFILIKKLLDSIDTFKSKTIVKKTVTETPINRMYVNADIYANDNNQDTLVYSSAPKIVQINKEKIIKTNTITTKLSLEQENLIHKIGDVVKKHEKE